MGREMIVDSLRPTVYSSSIPTTVADPGFARDGGDANPCM